MLFRTVTTYHFKRTSKKYPNVREFEWHATLKRQPETGEPINKFQLSDGTNEGLVTGVENCPTWRRHLPIFRTGTRSIWRSATFTIYLLIPTNGALIFDLKSPDGCGTMPYSNLCRSMREMSVARLAKNHNHYRERYDCLYALRNTACVS